MFVFSQIPPCYFYCKLTAQCSHFNMSLRGVLPEAISPLQRGDCLAQARNDMSGNPALRQVAHIVEGLLDFLGADGIIVVAVPEEPRVGFLDR